MYVLFIANFAHISDCDIHVCACRILDPMWVHTARAEGLRMKCPFSNVPGEALTLPWKSVVAGRPLGVWEGCLYLRPALEGAQALRAQPIPRLLTRASHTSSPKRVFPSFRESSPVQRGVDFTLLGCK